MTETKKKLIYLASPFFKPNQVETIEKVEFMVTEAGLALYSPRHDGVLMGMTPAERLAAAPKIFKLNVSRIVHADAVLAVLDDWDAGTTWEVGFAFAHIRYNMGHTPNKLFAFTSERPTLNVMLQQSFSAHAVGWEALGEMLRNYAQDLALAAPAKTSDVL